MQDEHPYAVLQRYGGLRDVLEEYQCSPQHTRATGSVMRVDTEWGTCALKRADVPEERLYYAFGCAEHVARAGMAKVPRFIRNRYGDPFVHHDTGLYYMTQWFAGRAADFRTEVEFIGGVRTLALWHELARGYTGVGGYRAPSSHFVRRMHRRYEALTRFEQIARNHPQPTQFETYFIAAAEELRNRLEQGLARLTSVFTDSEADAIQAGWVCHGDYVRKNVGFDGETFAVLNYEYVHPGHPMLDVAFYMHRYMNAFDWDVNILERALSSYADGVSSAPAQFEVLAALLSLPLRALQVVSKFYWPDKGQPDEDLASAFALSMDTERKKDAVVAMLSAHARAYSPPPSDQSAGALQVETASVHIEHTANDADARLPGRGASSPSVKMRGERPRRKQPRKVNKASTAQPKLWGDATWTED